MYVIARRALFPTKQSPSSIEHHIDREIACHRHASQSSRPTLTCPCGLGKGRKVTFRVFNLEYTLHTKSLFLMRYAVNYFNKPKDEILPRKGTDEQMAGNVIPNSAYRTLVTNARIARPYHTNRAALQPEAYASA